MKTFAYHENASGVASFTKTGDAWSIDEANDIYAVADSPLRCLIRDAKEYPFDDHGYDAANTFCKSFVRRIKEVKEGSNFSEEVLKQTLYQCNEDIKELNIKLGKKYGDPLNYDLAETVGSGVVIKDGKLYYGGVEDCCVNVLRGENLENIAKWKEQIVKAEDYIDKLSAEGKLSDFVPNELVGKLKKDNEWEPCWCNHLRNNINAKDEKGECVGFGCFTGEEGVKDFIQTYSLELQKGDHILIFSDGMIPVFEKPEFISWFLQNASNSFYFQYQMRLKIQELLEGKEAKDKEKTLLYFQY